MSLLIKALDKAQEAKTKQPNQDGAKKTQAKRVKTTETADAGLTLSPSAVDLQDPTTQKPTARASNTPTQAANVFLAKRNDAPPQSSKLPMMAGAGLAALLAVGVYYYWQINKMADIPAPPIRTAQAAPPAPIIVAEAPTEVAPAPVNPVLEAEPTIAPETTQAFAPVEAEKPAHSAQKAKKRVQPNQTEAIFDEPSAQDAGAQEANVQETLEPNEVLASNKISKKTGFAKRSNMLKMDKPIASESASIQVTHSKPRDAINPTLMRAYEAYNAGNDSEAQKLYKQVLQRESTNIDAMLGLGAIATRQGRTADANAWYRKVLSLEPRNSTAQAAMLEVQDDPQTSESSIKSMLAKSPNDANLHAALGNLYAEQNDWRSAQQAYFDAFRFNESAENAFNLGVSLDQIGKPKLALPYYQQALQMVQQNGASSVDQAALEARIQAIQ